MNGNVIALADAIAAKARKARTPEVALAFVESVELVAAYALARGDKAGHDYVQRLIVKLRSRYCPRKEVRHE